VLSGVTIGGVKYENYAENIWFEERNNKSVDELNVLLTVHRNISVQ
jgi:hypothetical protein